MEIKVTRSNIIKNLIWKFMERMSSQLVTFIVSIMLARLLEPTDYGIIAIINIFISIANTLVTSGFTSALIQKKSADELDFSSVFFLNIASSTFLYIILFFCADIIAGFYAIPKLSIYLRVLGLQVIIYAFNSVQQAYLSRNLMFKKFFFSTLTGTILSGTLGIIMAYSGFGVWALIAQSLSSSIINAVILWLLVKWVPVLKISLCRVKILFQYGWKILCSAMLASAYEQITGLLIGKMYTSADLAYYSRGQNYPSLLVTNINSSINSILFPAISNTQGDQLRGKMLTRRAIQMSLFILAPMLIGLAAVAKPLVDIMLTDKWLPCVPYLQLFCIYFLMKPIQTATLSAIQATGKSGLFLRLEVIKDIIGFLLLILLARYSVFILAFSILIANAMSLIVNMYFIKKELCYGYYEQFKDIGPYISMAIIMGAIIYPIQFVIHNPIYLLMIQIAMGAGIYTFEAIFFRVEAFNYILNILQERKHAKSST